MADEMFFLTAQDRDDLSMMLAEWRAEPENPRRPRLFRQRFQTPEVYVAKVPPSGIPALSQTGTTGTGTEQPLDDIPGRAECEIFALDAEDASALRFNRLEDETRYVYNLSPRAISADETPWVTIHRDKFGEWYVAAPRSSAATDLDFEEIVETVNVVTGVFSRECGLTIQNTPFTFTFRLPVGSNVTVTAGGSTGTGTADDGNDTIIDFATRLVDIPTSAAFTFDSATCTGAITFTTTPVCFFTGGLECCPDYTGTGTS